MDGVGAEEEQAPEGLGKEQAAGPGRSGAGVGEAPGKEPNEQPRGGEGLRRLLRAAVLPSPRGELPFSVRGLKGAGGNGCCSGRCL